ncbi:formate dehydrogenase subunit gamma [Pseudaminobacter arsenicus]|uniref:Formate dehydrogenase subunit gamma n=1 Tax=Borborobacter arsenicus TaxID=1851146 RepID=A0A432V0U8_9HYPH|nr:formate dehydrogenase subunit gamma [Pseudaminobacter arsenicus]RUM95834.1 formate dehydrogenase subunit gamma [Pseudaminobacter arsenicus]
MRVFKLSRPGSRVVAAIILIVGLLAIAPVGAQAPSGINPTAQAVNEQQLLDELSKIQGRITIPDKKAATLQQPQGRDFRGFHEGVLPWIGAIAVLGMLVVLALFYFIRGRVRMLIPESGVKLLRFNVIERLAHWTTATAFIVLAITGLNFVFGKRILMPLIGADAFSSWSQWAKYAHDFLSWAFMLGVLAILVMWVWGNLPDRYDAHWLKVGGGLFDKSNRTHPPAARFNAGQKLIFWSVILGGATLSVSGIFMLFPFAYTDVNGMQLAQTIHAVVGVLMIAVILGHIYIGTLGMEGAYEAMGSGTVDLNWAKQHHSVWVERQEAKATPSRTAATPAE